MKDEAPTIYDDDQLIKTGIRKELGMINQAKSGLDPTGVPISKNMHSPGIFLTETLAIQTIAEQFSDTRRQLSVSRKIVEVQGWKIDLWFVCRD